MISKASALILRHVVERLERVQLECDVSTLHSQDPHAYALAFGRLSEVLRQELEALRRLLE